MLALLLQKSLHMSQSRTSNERQELWNPSEVTGLCWYGTQDVPNV